MAWISILKSFSQFVRQKRHLRSLSSTNWTGIFTNLTGFKSWSHPFWKKRRAQNYSACFTNTQVASEEPYFYFSLTNQKLEFFRTHGFLFWVSYAVVLRDLKSHNSIKLFKQNKTLLNYSHHAIWSQPTKLHTDCLLCFNNHFTALFMPQWFSQCEPDKNPE